MWLLSYELRQAARHRYFISVALVASETKGVDVAALITQTLRCTDEVFAIPARYAVVMGHTGTDEADVALRRLLGRCNGEIVLRCGLAGYPHDGANAAALMETAERRLEAARRAKRGAMVTEQ